MPPSGETSHVKSAKCLKGELNTPYYTTLDEPKPGNRKQRLGAHLQGDGCVPVVRLLLAPGGSAAHRLPQPEAELSVAEASWET